MRSEARDWSPVLFDDDPTPGEEQSVRELAHEMRSMAEALHQESERLQRAQLLVAAPVWSGMAAEAFAERTRTVWHGARVASHQHQTVADAAHAWAGAMQSAQSTADLALELAVEALEDLERTQSLIGTLAADHAALLAALTQQNLLTTAPSREQLMAEQETAALRRRVGDVESDLTLARFHREDAQQRLDSARYRARIAQEEYETAEDIFVRQVETTFHGAPTPSEWRPTEFASTFSTLTRLDATESGSMDLLRTLTPDEFASLLAATPGLMQRYWDDPPRVCC